MYTSALPYVALLSLFWGTNVVASRFGVGEFNPYFFVTLRLSIAALFFIPILLYQQGKLPTDITLLRNATISGVLGVAIPMPTFILSLQYQSSGVASLYVMLFPVMMIVAAHFFLPDEQLTRAKAFGVLLALGGALFLAVRGESGLVDVSRANPLGFLLVLVGLISEVANTLHVRLRMQATDPMQVTSIRLFVAAIIVLLVTSIIGEFTLSGVTGAGYFSLAYAALIGALGGQFMAFYVQRNFSATAFSLSSYMVPIVATLFGALLLDEIITWAMGVGILLIGSGLFAINHSTA